MDTCWNKALVCLFLISEDGTWWYQMVNSHLSHILGGQKLQTISCLSSRVDWFERLFRPTPSRLPEQRPTPLIWHGRHRLASYWSRIFFTAIDTLHGDGHGQKRKPFSYQTQGCLVTRGLLCSTAKKSPIPQHHTEKMIPSRPLQNYFKTGLFKDQWVPFLSMLFFSDSDSDDETWKVLIILDA